MKTEDIKKDLNMKKLEQGLKDIKENKVIKIEIYAKKRRISLE